MNIYLDVDGVLLTKDGVASQGLVEFLTWAIKNHSCYWLTTRCKGDSTRVKEVLMKAEPKLTENLLNEIKVTNWNTYKTEAIDFSSDFRWLDDYVMMYEEKTLKDNNAIDKLIKINLKENPNQLAEIRGLYE